MRENDLAFSRHLRYSTLTLFICIYLLYIISSFYPDSFLWGVNHLAFFEDETKIIILLLAFLLGWPFFSSLYLRAIKILDDLRNLDKFHLSVLLLIIGAVSTGIFYHLRIGTDMYGDTRTLLSLIASKQYTFGDIFSFADKEPLTRLIHQQIARMFGLDQKFVFQLVSSICGGIYVITLLLFVKKIQGVIFWKFLIIIISLTAGVNQLFFGHVEDYTLVYLAIIIFLMLAWFIFEGKRVLGWMTIIFLIGVRLHIEMVLMLPAFLYVILFMYQAKYPQLKKWKQPKRIMISVFAVMVISILFYFFYFKAYRYDVGDQQEILQKIFLPLENWLPPPHEYTLLSLNHLSDVIQQFLFTVSPAVVLIICASVGCYRYLSWKEPRIIFFLLTVFFYFVFDFTINPMLTMPRDWDLLSPAAASVNFLAIALSQQLLDGSKDRADCTFLVGVALAISLLSSTIFFINADEEKAALRLENVGKWTYKSYYFGSAYIINVGEKMIKDIDKQIEHREKTIQDLLPYASKPDINLSLLYYKLGNLYYQHRNFNKASLHYSNALYYDPENASAIKSIGLVALQLWNFEEALKMFSFYNKHIKDTQVVKFEQYARGLLEMQNAGVAKVKIQQHLDELYEQNK